MNKNSELTIKDISNLIHQFCPIQIYFNNVLVWDDDEGEILFNEFFKWMSELENIVYSIKFDIVQFHHSIVYLEINE